MTTRAHRKPVPVSPELREHAAAVHRTAIVIDGMCTDHIEDPHNKLRWNEPYLQRLRQFATFFDIANPKAKPLADARVRLAPRPDQTIRVGNMGVTPK